MSEVNESGVKKWASEQMDRPTGGGGGGIIARVLKVAGILMAQCNIWLHELRY